MDKKIGFGGEINEKKLLKIGYIGCGSHSRRNILPTFSYVNVKRVAICDLQIEKAEVFAKEFGFERCYSNHLEMLSSEELDAVFIVTRNDEKGRPLYCRLAADCINAGVDVWMEKPPAAEAFELEALKELSKSKGKQVMIGLKKMFFPANEKAKELIGDHINMALLQYPERIPTKEEFDFYFAPNPSNEVEGFLDHICHPASLMIFFMGYPKTLQYARSADGGGVANFTFENGSIASIALTRNAGRDGGMERSMLIGENRHVLVDNNIRVSLNRTPPNLQYGASPSYYSGKPEEVTAVWEPEFSLGQLYNKGIFLLGYYNEINTFCEAILADRPIMKGNLDDAIMVTKIFKAFAEGENKLIQIK